MLEKALKKKLSIITLLNGSSMMAVVIEELDDSFTLGMASRLLRGSESGIVQVEPIYPTPECRLFKAGILSIIPLTPPFERHYLEFLADNFEEALTEDILTIEDMEIINHRLDQLEEDGLVELPDNITFIFPEGDGVH